MPMTPEERRKRDRERKARQRAANREKPKLEALPQIGPEPGAGRGTERGTSADAIPSNLEAAREVVAELEVPARDRWRVALVLRLAADLDAPLAIPQRSGLAAKYEASLEALIAAAKPRERDELDELRRRFYTGRTDDVDNDPEARKRPARKKA